MAMLLHIPQLLTADEVAQLREQLSAATWLDGTHSAGPQAAQVKHNLQLDPRSDLAQQLSERITQALQTSTLFQAAALPLRTLTPQFNRYVGGGAYGLHVDGSVMTPPLGGASLRSDVSSTLFLCEPAEYEGGELVVMDSYGRHDVKLPAGDLIVYPASSLHQVLPVTRGERLCAFFWTQSMVRDDARRSMLFDLDQAIQSLRNQLGDRPECVVLTAHYHNLLRMWAEL
jgi:PKHD-type hydroxylase